VRKYEVPETMEANPGDSMHTFDHSKPGICRLLDVAILAWHGVTLQGNLLLLGRACLLSEDLEMNLQKKVAVVRTRTLYLWPNKSQFSAAFDQRSVVE
jgi:hypothetical protein